MSRHKNYVGSKTVFSILKSVPFTVIQQSGWRRSWVAWMVILKRQHCSENKEDAYLLPSEGHCTPVLLLARAEWEKQRRTRNRVKSMIRVSLAKQNPIDLRASHEGTDAKRWTGMTKERKKERNRATKLHIDSPIDIDFSSSQPHRLQLSKAMGEDNRHFVEKRNWSHCIVRTIRQGNNVLKERRGEMEWKRERETSEAKEWCQTKTRSACNGEQSQWDVVICNFAFTSITNTGQHTFHTEQDPCSNSERRWEGWLFDLGKDRKESMRYCSDFLCSVLSVCWEEEECDSQSRAADSRSACLCCWQIEKQRTRSEEYEIVAFQTFVRCLWLVKTRTSRGWSECW